MRRIKVFLGAYLNYTNAQNLNCLAIARYLDEDRFEPLSLTTHFGRKQQFNIRTFNCFRPFILSKNLGFLWGIFYCDIAYLPKHVDTPVWVLILARILNRPIFTTIEGNVSDRSKSNLIDLFDNEKKLRKHFSYFNQVFPISRYLSSQSGNLICINRDPLYLGVDSTFYSDLKRKRNGISRIIFLGGVIKRKRVDEFLLLAKYFPDLKFDIIGDGSERKSLQEVATSNVQFLGKLSQSEIKDVFSVSDLLFLPSKSEGFPKVILEASSAGIPSIVYGSYGASDWIKDRDNGFVVSTFDQVIDIVRYLIQNPEKLEEVSLSARDLAKSFDWKSMISNWEKVIIELLDKKHNVSL